MIKLTHNIIFRRNTMNTFCKFSYTDAPLSLMPNRPERSNKGDFGRILCVCGSRGMAGAAYLSALGAYRSGAGLVEIFTVEENRVILQTLIPEAIIKTYEENTLDTDLLSISIEQCDAIVIGCGLGKSQSSLSLLKTVLKESKVPTVIDADALNIISEHKFLLKYTAGKIITPHMGEMSRLCEIPIDEILKFSKEIAFEFAKKHSLVCVLKDHNTIASDGSERIYVNNCGNCGMSTGGSGDVLAGVIASVAAQCKQEKNLLDIASLGVYIHALAGDTAAQKLGIHSVMARDIANEIKIQ